MLRRVRISPFVMALLISVATTAPVFGAECLNATFPESVKSGDAVLQLNGLGIRKATVFAVKVYVAGLYVPRNQTMAGRFSAPTDHGSLCSASFAMLTPQTSAMPSTKDSRALPATSWRRCAHALTT